MILLYIILLIPLVMLINFHWRRRHLYLLSWSMNGGYALPILGDAYKVMCKPEDVLENYLSNVTNVYPSPIKFWFGPKFSVIFTEVNQVQKILLSTKFIQKGDVYLLLQEYDGEGLITSSSSKWKKDHRLITPYLTNKQTEKYFPCMLDKCETLVKILKGKVNQPKFDIKKYVSRCLGEIVFETILGLKLCGQENGELDIFLKHTNLLYVHSHERMAKFWLHNDFLYTLLGYKERGQKSYRILADTFYNALNSMKRIHEKEEYLDEETSDKSLLNRLLYIRDKHPDFATDKEIIDHLATFYTAAEDTTTITVCFTLKVLGMYPEIQDKLYAELRSVFGSTPRAVTMKDLQELRYLKMCIKDIMRLFPIGPLIVRTATEDFQIEKWVIPKDCMVILSIFNVHRDPSLWERPNDFYPEHFLPEAVAKRHPYAFIAFSAGPRACVGKPYAHMALYIILATLLQHYEFISEGKLQDKKLKADITTRFKDDDYSVRIIPRKQS